MIKEAYVSFEVAKLLKEKGFDECIFEFYEGDRIKYARNGEGFRLSELPDRYYPHITHQMACAWLREKHHIHANPIKQGNYNDCSDYYTWIVASNSTIYRNQSVADKLSYEYAVEAALKYSLENLL